MENDPGDPTGVQQLSRRCTAVHAQDPCSISSRSFDEKPRLPGQSQQISIATNQQIGFPALGEVEERLIVWVPTYQLAPCCHLDDFAIRKILSQEFPTIIGGELELWIAQNPGELRYGGARNQWH
jgi:hypothetical protein